MKKIGFIFAVAFMVVSISARGQVLSLEECRSMAVEQSKELMIGRSQADAARSLKKSAFTQYLPNISAAGAYVRNSDNVSLLSEDKYAPVGTLRSDGSFGFRQDQVDNAWTMIDGHPVPLDANGVPFNPKSDPDKIQWRDYAYLPKDEFTIDSKNIFAAGLTLLQPVYLGGKIRELNRMAACGERLAEAQVDAEKTEVLYQVDVAYWQVVSVAAKLKIAEKYRALLERLATDLEVMQAEGVATKGDVLKVRVRYNEVDLTVIRAQNGLSLARALLCQLIGLPQDAPVRLADEEMAADPAASAPADTGLEGVYARRPEIRQLELSVDLAESQRRMALSRFLPNIGVAANYLYTNPNPFNGFKNEFKGSWNVGVSVSVPIFHFGDRIHTLNAAKAGNDISRYRLELAREKVELQVRQSSFKVEEAARRMAMMGKNVESAEENLRTTELAFAEGVASLTVLMEAQAAWQAAQAERLEAAIDVRLCNIYLLKATGNLND